MVSERTPKRQKRFAILLVLLFELEVNVSTARSSTPNMEIHHNRQQTYNQRLLELYGEAGRRLNKDIQTLRKTSARLINRKNFLIKCRELKDPPIGVGIKLRKHNQDRNICKKNTL